MSDPMRGAIVYRQARTQIEARGCGHQIFSGLTARMSEDTRDDYLAFLACTGHLKLDINRYVASRRSLNLGIAGARICVIDDSTSLVSIE